jgi:VIT1/CCC1 family predicted Fe2+/Mn2+ transporter
LGIDPKELGGSALEAALMSFGLFALGAIIPVIPFLVTSGYAAVLSSLGLSTLALFGIGAAITLVTSQPLLKAGMRQIIFGLLAAGVTFGIGHLVGVHLGG